MDLLNLLKFLARYILVFCERNRSLAETSWPIGCFLPIALDVELAYDDEKIFSLIKPLICPV